MEQTAQTFGLRSSFELSSKQWARALWKTKLEAGKDNLGIVSAGVAFYVFLGIFPLLAAFISVYGIVSSPEDIMAAFESFKGVIPDDIVAIAQGQLSRLASSSAIASKAAFFSFLAATWSGSRAVKGMMSALSIVNGKKDERHFIVRTFVSLALTSGAIVLGVMALVLLAVLPGLIIFFKLEGIAVIALHVARWTLLALVVATGLSVLFRFGPDRRGASWRWLTPGSLFATLIWLAASALFSWFVANFGNYNKFYGSLGAIAILMLWLSLSAFFFISGAELDVELERARREKGNAEQGKIPKNFT